MNKAVSGRLCCFQAVRSAVVWATSTCRLACNLAGVPLTRQLRVPTPGPHLAKQGRFRRQPLPRLAPLLGPNTLIVPAMNGVPWWFCHGQAGQDKLQQALDPDGHLAALLR